jgi:hypothetical protein
MSTEIRWRRGTAAQTNAFTGAPAEVTVDTTSNQLVVHDGVTSGGFRTVMAGVLAAVAGSSLVGFIQSGVGAVLRTLQDKGREVVSVKDFGAVGDGVTDDTTAIQAAVTACVASGETLYWPAGAYLTTANIPSFHSAQHTGKGAIVRGADTFYIEPTDAQTNTVYFATTGNDSSDGLSSLSPLLTLNKVKAVLINTTPNQRGGTWVIKFAAGTYSDSTNFPDLPTFRNDIKFMGTGTSRDPQTVFDGTSAAYQTAGMYFQNGTKIYMQYIKFANFVTGYGVLSENNTSLELVDCTADACAIGFSAGYSSFIRTTRCLANNCTGSGFRTASNGQASFAPTTDNIADSNRAIGCGYGFTITRNSYAHIDYNEIEDCTNAGIVIEINSRSAALGNNFKRNGVGIRCWTSGYVSTAALTPNVFNQGTADANTETYEFRGTSGNVSLYGQSGTVDTSVYKAVTATTVTGTNALTQIGGTLYTAPAGWFIDGTKRVKLRVWGSVTTPVDGTVSLQFKAAGTNLAAPSLPASLAAQPFGFEVECIATAGNAQKTFSKLSYNGGAVITEIQVDTIDFTALDRAFTFHTDANGVGATSVSITVESVEVTVCG